MWNIAYYASDFIARNDVPAFITSYRIEWGDCDEAGIVFYPNYFYWLDCRFQRLLRERFGAVTPLLDAGLNFRSPGRYDDELSATADITDWQEKRFRIDYRLSISARLVAEGHELRAWAILTDTGLKGAPVAEEFRRIMA